jgi:hypothetical protein
MSNITARLQNYFQKVGTSFCFLLEEGGPFSSVSTPQRNVSVVHLMRLKLTSTCTKIYTHEMLESLLHVLVRHRCHHQEVLSESNVAPSEWSVAN